MPAVRVSHEEILGKLPGVLSKHWGLDVIIKPRAKESLREAIQALGHTRKHETIYTYTGWRQINGQWVFLHVGGAVGAKNIRVNIGEGGENSSGMYCQMRFWIGKQLLTKLFPFWS